MLESMPGMAKSLMLHSARKKWSTAPSTARAILSYADGPINNTKRRFIMQLNTDENDYYIISPNFIDTGTVLGGSVKLRNAVEA